MKRLLAAIMLLGTTSMLAIDLSSILKIGAAMDGASSDFDEIKTETQTQIGEKTYPTALLYLKCAGKKSWKAGKWCAVHSGCKNQKDCIHKALNQIILVLNTLRKNIFSKTSVVMISAKAAGKEGIQEMLKGPGSELGGMIKVLATVANVVKG